MTTIDPTAEVTASGVEAGDSALGRLLAAVADWLTSTDHKKIGRLFLGGGLLGLLATVAINLIIGIERSGIGNIDDRAIPQILDAQRVGLMFGTLLPLAIGLCVAVVPMQLGARSLAFPRLAATGFWMWVGGLIFSMIALANNGGGLGGDPDMVDLFLGAHGLMAIGLAAVGVSIATSVLTTRAPGMTMRRVPFFSMSALVMGLGLVVVMPVLLGTLTYLFVDHRNGREAFGGNTGLYDWAGWIFSPGAAALFALPVAGLLADGAPLLFKQRTPARGIVFAGFGLMGVAALGSVTQDAVHSVPWNGSDLFIGGSEDVRQKLYDVVPWAMFNLLPLLGLTVVLLMSLFLAKPVKGARPNVTPALAFGFLGLGMVMVGMIGTALFAIDDLGLQGTVFAEGALIYVVYGTVLAALGGMAYWAPKLWGVNLPAAKVLPLAGLGVIATVLASLPSYVAGFDAPRDVYAILVLVGHVLMALTVLSFIGLLVTSVTSSTGDVENDPYGGQTLEWATSSPAPANNFADAPTVTSAEPLADITSDDSQSDSEKGDS
ncbi:MAG: cytochrome o ubiquinol oxidase subunit 1 [Gammaproteobacteria bacterium]|jgi:cytochrome o ubiquinol oxidase subunit 1